MKIAHLKKVLFLGLSLFCSDLFASDNADYIEPRWKSSFSVKINESEFHFNQWFIDSHGHIGASRQQEIRNHFNMRSPRPNIARAQLNFICEHNEQLTVVPVDFDVTLLSGKKFTGNVKDDSIFSQALGQSVVSTRSFYGDDMSGRELNKNLRSFFKTTYNIDLSNPDHSENSALIFMEEKKFFLEKIPHGAIIQGLFLQFLSYNDSCNPCLKLFNKFSLKIKERLCLEKDSYNFSISNTLSVLVFVCGIQEYVYLEKQEGENKQQQVKTRSKYKKDSTQIQIKNGETLNEVYLSTIEDIKINEV